MLRWGGLGCGTIEQRMERSRDRGKREVAMARKEKIGGACVTVFM